ncbi:MAG: putative methylase [Candidatus Methanomethylophilaceae archaeon]|nr:putative methylase [Candidatus Methanomethylophilaceae archaeon]
MHFSDINVTVMCRLFLILLDKYLVTVRIARRRIVIYRNAVANIVKSSWAKDINAECITTAMKKKDLEIALEMLEPISGPDASLEQYPTPATVVADIVFEAYRNGDVAGMKVLDLGCGNGVFAIAAALMGAETSLGYDISEKAVLTARKNALSAGVDSVFFVSDVKNVNEGADTVFMNPPFGCQNRNADRPFLDRAMDLSECVYSMHKAETTDFVIKYCEKRGRKASLCKIYKYDIPHTFEFHRETKRSIEIAVVNIR